LGAGAKHWDSTPGDGCEKKRKTKRMVLAMQMKLVVTQSSSQHLGSMVEMETKTAAAATLVALRRQSCGEVSPRAATEASVARGDLARWPQKALAVIGRSIGVRRSRRGKSPREKRGGQG
jgi:hypothetical protein